VLNQGGGTGLFTAFFDATVSIAVAGLFYGVVLTSLRLRLLGFFMGWF
jgi:hypothetical protein